MANEVKFQAIVKDVKLKGDGSGQVVFITSRDAAEQLLHISRLSDVPLKISQVHIGSQDGVQLFELCVSVAAQAVV